MSLKTAVQEFFTAVDEHDPGTLPEWMCDALDTLSTAAGPEMSDDADTANEPMT